MSAHTPRVGGKGTLRHRPSAIAAGLSAQSPAPEPPEPTAQPRENKEGGKSPPPGTFIEGSPTPPFTAAAPAHAARSPRAAVPAQRSPCPSPRLGQPLLGSPAQGSAGRAAPEQGAAPLPPFLAGHCRCLATASPPHAVRPGRGSPTTRTPPFISTGNSSPRGRGQLRPPAARRGPSRGGSGGCSPPRPGAVPSGQGGKAPPPHPRVSFMARAHSPRRRPRFPPFCTAAPFPAAPAPPARTPARRPLAAAAGCVPSRRPRRPLGLQPGSLSASGDGVPSPCPCSFPEEDSPSPRRIFLLRGVTDPPSRAIPGIRQPRVAPSLP